MKWYGFISAIGFMAIVCLILIGANSSPAAEPAAKPTYHLWGYQWEENTAKCDNIVSHRHRLEADAAQHVQEYVDVTNKQPDGHRVIFDWWLYRGIDTDPKDVCLDDKGAPTKYRGIWLDNGVAQVKQRYEAFFKEYKRLGGKLDVLVLDFEGGMTHWSVGPDPKAWEAIQKDPRFPDIAKELGFNDLSDVYTDSNYKAKNDKYLKWWALMDKRMADYVNQATYEVVKKYYPNVQMNNYGNAHWNEKLAVPDPNGYLYEKFFTGSHVGTHQGPVIYSNFGGNLTNFAPGGLKEYTQTPFNGFRLAINYLRCAAGSSPVPVAPWFSHKAYPDSMVKDTDLYQEMVFHSALCGATEFMYWNPRPHSGLPPAGFCDDKQDILFSNTLKEADAVIGDVEKRIPLSAGELAQWDGVYILTGMDTGKQSIWRFTPSLDEGKSSLKETKECLISASPATFALSNGHYLVIPKGKVVELPATVSNAGYWITAPRDAKPKELAELPKTDENNDK